MSSSFSLPYFSSFHFRFRPLSLSLLFRAQFPVFHTCIRTYDSLKTKVIFTLYYLWYGFEQLVSVTYLEKALAALAGSDAVVLTSSVVSAYGAHLALFVRCFLARGWATWRRRGGSRRWLHLEFLNLYPVDVIKSTRIIDIFIITIIIIIFFSWSNFFFKNFVF